MNRRQFMMGVSGVTVAAALPASAMVLPLSVRDVAYRWVTLTELVQRGITTVNEARDQLDMLRNIFYVDVEEFINDQST